MSARRAVLFCGVLALSGCGPSEEQQAERALRRGVAHAEKREFYKAIGQR